MPHQVVLTFVEHAEDYLKASLGKQLALAFMAGAFITFGAMLSVALTVGVKPMGIAEAVLGLGFTAGFVMVILSGAALFTEVNVLVPELMLSRRRAPLRLLRFWLVVYLGNAVGAIAVAALLNWARVLGPEQTERLIQLLAVKLQFQHTGIEGWLRAVGSGAAANWLVGMAAFLAVAARTVAGKILGIALPIITFVALGLQHSPANIGHCDRLEHRSGHGWQPARWRDLCRAAVLVHVREHRGEPRGARERRHGCNRRGGRDHGISPAGPAGRCWRGSHAHMSVVAGWVVRI
jgi:formate transporter